MNYHGELDLYIGWSLVSGLMGMAIDPVEQKLS